MLIFWWSRGPDLNRGPADLQSTNSPNKGDKLTYTPVREQFIRYLANRLSKSTADDYIKYLDKYFGDAVVRSPEELKQLLAKADNGKPGRWNWLINAIRVLIRFHLETGRITQDFAFQLKRVLKERPEGVDVRLPSDEEVRQALSKVEDERMLVVGLLCLFGGIRVKEAIKLVNEFDRSKLHIEDGIAYYELGWRRKSKISYYVFMPIELAERLRRFRVTYDGVGGYFVKRGLPLKYARKWFINKMIESGVQESVVKFMIGHSQGGDILATHYINLFHQARKAYKENVERLKQALDFPTILASYNQHSMTKNREETKVTSTPIPSRTLVAYQCP